MPSPTLTASDFINTPGFKAGREDWLVFNTDREAFGYKKTAPCYSLESCPMCGNAYLRAHGVRGRTREYCADVCRQASSMMSKLGGMLERIAANADGPQADAKLAALRSEVFAMGNSRRFAQAVHRNSQARKALADENK